MGSWLKLADDLGTDAALSDLDEAQIKAVIDLLALVMYADDKATVMEEVELEDQLNKLPWMAQKEALVRSHLEAAREAAEAVGGQAGAGRIADAAAKALGRPLGEKILGMAAALAFADLQLAVAESAVLQRVAAAFGIDPARAQQIIDAAG